MSAGNTETPQVKGYFIFSRGKYPVGRRELSILLVFSAFQFLNAVGDAF